jgi:hypothetical protein
MSETEQTKKIVVDDDDFFRVPMSALHAAGLIARSLRKEVYVCLKIEKTEAPEDPTFPIPGPIMPPPPPWPVVRNYSVSLSTKKECIDNCNCDILFIVKP